jgi:prefoldin subunit 5
MTKADISKLHSQRRKHKARLDTNFRSLSDQYNDLEERMTEMTGLYTTLSDQTENLAQVDLPEVQALVDTIQDKIDSFTPLQESIKDSLTRIQNISDTVDGIKAMCHGQHSLI